ncbi:MAG: hypothetical protein WC965_01195 [Thiohalomonadaceae bacterium]
MTIQEMLEAIRENGGFTVDLDGKELPKRGYFVSMPGRERVYALEDLTEDRLSLYTATVPHDKLLGAWVDDGCVYLDASEHFTRKRDAIKAGRERGQKAIWDVAKGIAIFLDTPE